MANGVGGPLGGFGETIFDATKKQAGQVVQQVSQQVTGKPLPFGQAKPQGSTFTPPSQGGAGSPPLQGLDNFGDFAKLFEKNKVGGKTPPPAAAQTQYMTPQQLQEMQSEQEAKDAQEIARLTQELHQMTTKSVMGSGESALKKQQEYMENLHKEEEEKWERDRQEKAQQNAGLGQMQPGQMVDLGPVQSQSQSNSPITSAQRSGEAKYTE